VSGRAPGRSILGGDGGEAPQHRVGHAFAPSVVAAVDRGKGVRLAGVAGCGRDAVACGGGLQGCTPGVEGGASFRAAPGPIAAFHLRLRTGVDRQDQVVAQGRLESEAARRVLLRAVEGRGEEQQ
jgi:hypothetical protein